MRILDLFCGAGGAAMGLHQSFPDAEIVGIDIKPQPHYPFKFFECDVFNYPWEYQNWNFIWASPPCQRYSVVTPRTHRMAHPDLICKVRRLLNRTGIPFVIENVTGAYWRMNHPVMLCGSMFGLRTRRHRLFEASFKFQEPKTCDHSERPLLVTTAGANSRNIGNYKSVKNSVLAYGIDWMNGKELSQSIPPAYSRYIADRFKVDEHMANVSNFISSETDDSELT
jgi:DNA (cytosine-5)-methyltransferase 1